MRVAYIVSRFPHPTETFIAREVTALERQGVEVDLFALVRQRTASVPPEAAPWVPRLCSPRPWGWGTQLAQLYWLVRHPGRYARCWRRAVHGNLSSPRFLLRALLVVPLAAACAREIRRRGSDAVHAHWATHPALAAYCVGVLTGLPWSVTVHAHDLYVDRTMLDEKLRSARFVVTISEYNARLLRTLYGRDVAGKVHVVRCGVEHSDVPGAALNVARDRGRPERPGAGRSTGPVGLVCVASLQPYKGQCHLLDACALLREAGLRFSLTLVGDGEDRERLIAQARDLGLDEHVVFRGWQPSDQVRATVAESDIFVLPSVTTADGKMEGIPVAVMEALALGVPCVATDVSGVSELVRPGQTGLLVPERDAAALAAAIAGLAADPVKARRLGAAGRDHVARQFDLATNVTHLRRLLAAGIAPARNGERPCAERNGVGADERRDEGPLACVIGGIDIVAPLGRAGVRCAVSVAPDDPVRFSRHVVDTLERLDPWKEADRYVERLLSWARQRHEKPVLFYPTDAELVMASRHRDELAEGFRFVLPDPATVERLVDKMKFAALAAEVGLRVPPSVVVPGGDVGRLRYPVVVKPLTHATATPFSGKAVRVDRPDDLDALATMRFLVQELVPGPESRIESYHAYVDDHGVVADFTGVKVRTNPPEYGETTLLRITDEDDVRVAGRAVIAGIGFRGVCKIDFKRDLDGTLWLLEVNPRFNLWHHPGAAAGVNIPGLVFADLTGRSRPPVGEVDTSVTWVEPRALRPTVSRREWIVAVGTSTTRSTGPWSDPMPLLRGLVLPAARRRLRAVAP
jgi:glycosyltransferase involved in cell wall biosynthesis/predicted ATP-grasp superfamily ATP-dependent carboligase